MPHPVVSRKKAQAISTAFFLLGLAILILTDAWWPGIMLAIGIPLAIRQYLLDRHYDMGVTLLVFIGTFITVQFDISWRVFLPILFTMGALYILLREFFHTEETTEAEIEDDLNHELDEKK
jgi:hypothetical protein